MYLGSLFIISAPSGAGKSSLVKQLCHKDNLIKTTTSYTTRKIRNGEVDGREYFFIDLDSFKQMQEANEFLEVAQVYDNWYATNQNNVKELRSQGFDVILEIDHQGAENIKKLIPEAILIYVMPPNLQTLAKRLATRNTDDEKSINKRLALAITDASYANEYDYIIINDNFNQALDDLYSIIQVTRLKSEKVLTSFKLI